MNRSWHIWLLFIACLTLVMAAMGWATWTALRLDRAESAARRAAAIEENVRLALWRMDSALAPIVAQESAQPVSAYRGPQDAGDPARQPAPSAFLAYPSPYVRVHFQFGPDGRLSSPEVPARRLVANVAPDDRSFQAIEAFSRHLEHLARWVKPDQLMARLPAPSVQAAEPLLPDRRLAQSQPVATGRELERIEPFSRGNVEFRKRGAIVSNSNIVAQTQALMQNAAVLPAIDPSEAIGVPMTPLWIGDDLLLARRVSLSDGPYLQGCLLDWPKIEAWLVSLAADLVPGASLEPLVHANEASQSRQLAALPASLIPGDWVPTIPSDRWSAQVSLAIAWAGAALAVAAVGLLLWGVLRLSERRATFVSAVTHELRTPLTTFQMYTEMLAEGMVTDPRARHEYLQTLHREAGRLTHLVENVLAYARLERGRSDGRIECLPVGQLLQPIADRLAGYAAQAGMQLEVEIGELIQDDPILANPSALEQILVNLVDNACKYAQEAADRRIHLAVERVGDRMELRLRDHGPGISAAEHRHLFRPFSKSAAAAAQTAPGVGLGLALSRRLARRMQGELFCRNLRPGDGACFVLVLPCGGSRS